MNEQASTSNGARRAATRLSDLRLTADEFGALRRRGCVCCERRRGGVYFKLRFRSGDGRQRVRYLGSDPAVAEAIRRDLERLQRNRDRAAALRRLEAEARRLLRRVKGDLRETIEALGLRYHGFTLRRCRRGSGPAGCPGCGLVVVGEDLFVQEDETMAKAQDGISVSGNAAAERGATGSTLGDRRSRLTAADRAELLDLLRQEALDGPSAMAVNLRLSGGDLLEMSLLLKDAIRKASDGSPLELKQLEHSVGTYLKVCRQAGSIFRLARET